MNQSDKERIEWMMFKYFSNLTMLKLLSLPVQEIFYEGFKAGREDAKSDFGQ